jgi:hypothetical protein
MLNSWVGTPFLDLKASVLPRKLLVRDLSARPEVIGSLR